MKMNVKVTELEYDKYIKGMEFLIQKSMNKSTSVKVITVIKNNGKRHQGIRVDEGEDHIIPQIYLEEMYAEQRERGITLEDAVNEFLKIYQAVKCEFIPLDIFKWEYVKEHVSVKVINAEWNKELLKTVPCKRVLDLAIVYQIVLEMTEYDSATVLVKKEHLKQWGISEEELHEIAEVNSKKSYPANLKKMRDIVNEVLNIKEIHEDETDSTLYVLSNQYRMFGAVTFLYKGALEKIGEQLKSDFVIIPSSIHEVILLKDTHETDRAEIEEIIKHVNEKQVSIEERLSDHSYYYSVKDKRLSL